MKLIDKMRVRFHPVAERMYRFTNRFTSLNHAVDGLRKADSDLTQDVPLFDARKRRDDYLRIVLRKASFTRVCELLRADFSGKVQDKLVDKLVNDFNERFYHSLGYLANSLFRYSYVPFDEIHRRLWSAIEGNSSEVFDSSSMAFIQELRDMKTNVGSLIASGTVCSEHNAARLHSIIHVGLDRYRDVVNDHLEETFSALH